MKKTLVFLLLATLLLGAPQAFKITAQEQNPDGALPRESAAAGDIDGFSEDEDDIFSRSYERELLSRRFFQKTLPPLSRREKIAWAFRTSSASVLL
jgi:hypothetical protein